MWPKKLTVKPHEVCFYLFQLTHHPCFSLRCVYTLREYIIPIDISLKLNQALSSQGGEWHTWECIRPFSANASERRAKLFINHICKTGSVVYDIEVPAESLHDLRVSALALTSIHL